MSQVVKFEPGKTYATRSTVDADYIIRVTIDRRTARSVWVNGNGKAYRVDVYGGAEFIRPWGRYSMCPIIRADRAA
jgi:hypothetical protein